MTHRSIPSLDLPLALPLAGLDAHEHALVGRKALSLAELTRAGLPVPPAFAVTIHAYRAAIAPMTPAVEAALAAEGEAREAAFAAVKSAIATAPVPDAVAAAIREAYRALGGGRVAVRSSGTAEDLEGASFAGMYETFLHVEGEEAVVDAVRRCWASAWNARVAAYAARRGVDHREIALGVVVQRMVDAEVSGVMFTLDPVTGREERMRIEACFGLGEALVSGHVQPDRFVVDRHAGEALEREIATQALRLDRGPEGGVVEVALSPEDGSRPTLGEEELQTLAALGRRVQAYHQCPQDVEWVLAEGTIWLVQSRPITAICYDGIEGEWTTADFKDGGVSAGVCSPYMWSLYDYIWQQTMPGYLRAIKLLTHDEPVVWGRVFYGRPYWNCGEVKRCLHRVPGFNERTFDRDLGIEGAYEGDGVVIPVNLATIVNALPVLFALEADYKARLARNKGFVERFEAIAARYDADPAQLAPEALKARFRRLVVEDYWETESTYFYTIYNTSNAKLDFKVELDKANKKRREPLSYLNLIAGLKDVKHLDPLKDLWALARRVREAPAIAELVAATPAEALKDAILGSPHAAFWDEVATFLHRYRHHSVSELDITQPRWDEDPTWMLATLKAYVAASDASRDPHEANARQHALYLEEREKAEAHFAGQGLLGRIAARGFFAKLDLTRTYAWWREEIRDRSSRMYALLRRETLGVARMLGREGVLARPEDVWQLTFREVLDVLDGKLAPEAARALVERRREDGDGYRRFANPNELGRRFKVGEAAAVPEGAIAGIPCSPGVVTARVRVIRTIQEGHQLQPGEVLVTKFTDPGWTPLFSAIAGVVTETGGVLSHAAVIAREYGIPAVLAVPGATERLEDGQLVTVDGSTGAITQVEEG